LEAVRSGRASSVPDDQLRLLVDRLEGTLQRSYGFRESDAADAAQDALLSLLEVASEPDASQVEIQNPAAYLMWLARNRAIDRMRTAAHRTSAPLDQRPDTPRGHDDDAIASLLDRSATASSVAVAMRAALDAQDDIAVRVITAWLDSAEELGEAPPSRLVAERANVSHTTVNHALRRFASYFPSPDARSSND
jgi:DNA-directed RNA polymerase specialized sigma24 family protein